MDCIPPKRAENRSSQLVAVTHSERRRVRIAIALNRREIPFLARRILDTDVDAEAGAANIALDSEAVLGKERSNLVGKSVAPPFRSVSGLRVSGDFNKQEYQT